MLTKPAPMTDDQVRAVIEQFEQESIGFDSGDLSEKRAYALQRYLGEPYGDEIDGRSQAVDTGLRDTVEWVMPQVLRVFLAGDDVVKFDPFNKDDEQPAESETKYVNHVILEKNDAFNVFSTWFRDALISKVGYVGASWQQRRDVITEAYQGLPDDALSVLMADQSVQIVEDNAYPGGPPPPMPAPEAMQQGMGPMSPPPPPMLHDVKVRRVKESGFVRLHNYAPEEVRVHKSHREICLQDCVFVQFKTRKTISELRQDGYNIPDYVADDDGDEGDSDAEEARDRFGDDDVADHSLDNATKRVWFKESFARIDKDGDGIAELRKVCQIGRTVLSDDETDLIPIAAVTPIQFPHRHVGLGFDDLCNWPSVVKTAVMRQYLDNLYLANNGRYAADVNTVNVDDLLVSRPGGVVRTNGDPGNGIMPLVHPVIGDAALKGMEWVDSWRESATGVSAYYQGLNADALNQTATGVSQIMTASQGRVEAVVRSFATGVKELFSIVHALTLKNATSEERAKINGGWVTVDPREWVKRTSMSITVGLGTGTRDARIAQLMQLAQMQAQGVQVGIVKPPNLYATGKRITEEMGYKNADEFWTDPTKTPPEPPQPTPQEKVAQINAQAEMQRAQMAQQGDAQKLQATMQADVQKFHAEQQTKAQQIGMEAQAKEREQQNAQAVQASNDARDNQKMELEHQRELQRMAAEFAFKREEMALNAQLKREEMQIKAQAQVQAAAMRPQPQPRANA